MIDLRLPNITGTTDREQLVQIKSYLYQMAEQLNFAMNNLDTMTTSAVDRYVSKNALLKENSGSSNVDATATFNSIKGLIIKSADIVTAYYEEIERKFNSEYFAESDFGTYKQEIEQRITANSKSITQNFSEVQEITNNLGVQIQGFESQVEGLDTKIVGFGEEVGNINTDLSGVKENVTTIDTNLKDVAGNIGTLNEDLDGVKGTVGGLEDNLEGVSEEVGKVDGKIASAKDELNGNIDAVKGNVDDLKKEIAENTKYRLDTKAYIKSGLLYTETSGRNVYGIEIGQTDTVNDEEIFNKFARFTSDRLSFYDQNGNEVAYISDNKLYIPNAEIKASLKIGGLLDTVMDNGDIVTKWVGKG